MTSAWGAKVGGHLVYVYGYLIMSAVGGSVMGRGDGAVFVGLVTRHRHFRFWCVIWSHACLVVITLCVELGVYVELWS